MKVLLFCPAAPDKPHIQPETWASILGLEWPEMLDILVMRGDIEADTPHDKVLWKYRQARWKFLLGDYDALFTVEADMIIPSDALTKLVALDADVAYGLYCWRHGVPWWNAYLDVSPVGAWSLSEKPHLVESCWDQQIDVAGLGNGCTLIKRRVLERLDFRRPYQACQDWGLSLDCQTNGFTQRMDLSVRCGHIADWPSKFVIWPSKEKPYYHIEMEDNGMAWRYINLAGRYVPGVPKRDMTDEEWLNLTEDQRRVAFNLYQYHNPEEARAAVEAARAKYESVLRPVFNTVDETVKE